MIQTPPCRAGKVSDTLPEQSRTHLPNSTFNHVVKLRFVPPTLDRSMPANTYLFMGPP